MEFLSHKKKLWMDFYSLIIWNNYWITPLLMYFHNATYSLYYFHYSRPWILFHFVQCFEVKDGETQEEKEIMCIQVALILIGAFSYINILHIFIFIFAVNHIAFHMYICLLLLSIVVFVCHYVPPCEVSDGTVCLYACVNYFVYFSASVFFYH